MICFENCYHYYQSENGKFCDIWGDYGPTTPPTLVCYFEPEKGDSNAQ